MILLSPLASRVVGSFKSRSRDIDIEQAWIRVALTSVVVVYVAWLIADGRGFSRSSMAMLGASGFAIVVGSFQIWALKRAVASRVAMRYLGIFTDIAAVSVGMAAANDGGVPVIGVYLWVVVGNGFRFGSKYLLTAYWLSMLGFGLQLAFVPFWQDHRSIGIGLLLTGAVVPLYVLLLLSRLTAQKDAAVNLSNAKSRFVANVSHELRTPLTGIFAVYDLLRLRSLAPDERDLVAMLGNAVGTLKTSVDAVLQMSKLEAGAEQAVHRAFNLLFFLQQIGALARPQSVAKGLSWNVQVQQDVPSVVLGDPDHLSHVLGNLLNNAFKFTHLGSVTLSVSTVSTHIRFEVSDTGIGIPLDQQERLFERFVQVDNSATRRFTGTGLGTSIARDLTELMGGRIGVSSAPGTGSTFWVELPLANVPAQAVVNDWGSLRHVAIVGETSSDRVGICVALDALNLKSTVVAIDQLSTLDFSQLLAVLLVMNEGESTSNAESCIRALGANCPCVIISAELSETQRASLRRIGASDLLPIGLSSVVLGESLHALRRRLEMPAAGERSQFASTGILRPLKVLLADDNPSNQLLLARILSDAGHKVQTVERGDAAFDEMTAGNFDMAVLDLNMPDMTGPDVIKLFRASEIGLKKLPIVILSADATPAARIESLEAGADEFLTKPVTSAKLLNALERVMAASGGDDRPSQLYRPDSRSGSLSASSNVLVDADRLQALRQISRGDEQFLVKYVSAACAEIETALSDFRIAVTRHEIERARDALHIIEGTGGSIGAVALVANCRDMRHAVMESRAGECADKLAEFSTTYALTKSTLHASLEHPVHGRAGAKSG